MVFPANPIGMTESILTLSVVNLRKTDGKKVIKSSVAGGCKELGLLSSVK